MPNNLKSNPYWHILTDHQRSLASVHMKDLFADDAKRFETFSLEFDGLFLDYSKHRVTHGTMHHMGDLLRSCGVESWREKMFSGEAINTTEHRAVLHTALRRPVTDGVAVGGENIMPFVHDVLRRMKEFSEQVRSGVWKGHTGKTIRSVVNIGIGGSDLGPRMAYSALKPYTAGGINVHFVSNVDGADLVSALEKVDPEETLFLVASKTFTTQETMTNAKSAKAWLVKLLGTEKAVARHFAALSTNTEAVKAFGINEKLMFPFKDWVGGRYSLWSAIGLPLCIAIGFENFRAFLDGAHAMDTHFQEAPLNKNIPVIMAMLGVWYRNFWNAKSIAIIPYDQRLREFPSYLQQLDMESNGKGVDREGRPVTYATGPVVFGAPGTDAQHSFFQKIHQGPDFIPVDFIAAVQPHHTLADHHTLLLNNMLAQGQALMQGRTLKEADNDPHKVFEGNRPSSTILLDKLDPYRLGMLIALYEHKVFVQGICWNVNSFDQFGVELGKILAGRLGKDKPWDLDSSTAGLLKRIRG